MRRPPRTRLKRKLPRSRESLGPAKWLKATRQLSDARTQRWMFTHRASSSGDDEEQQILTKKAA
jgi:hypothetical protein